MVIIDCDLQSIRRILNKRLQATGFKANHMLLKMNGSRTCVLIQGLPIRNTSLNHSRIIRLKARCNLCATLHHDFALSNISILRYRRPTNRQPHGAYVKYFLSFYRLSIRPISVKLFLSNCFSTLRIVTTFYEWSVLAVLVFGAESARASRTEDAKLNRACQYLSHKKKHKSAKLTSKILQTEF